MKILEIEKLYFEINKNKILKNISFNLKVGSTLSIIGESGSGKTILSKLIMGKKIHLSNIKGKILYYGQNIFEFSDEELRKYRGERIGYITQNPFNVFHNFQKIKVFFYETLSSHKNITKEKIRKIAIKYLKEVNLENVEEILESYPFELSGGMLQRVMIAIIIALEPSIIIADEPTSALDSYNRFEIINIFKKLKKKGISFIIITHDYVLVKELADDIIVMKDGEILENAVLKNGNIKCKSLYGKSLVANKLCRRK